VLVEKEPSDCQWRAKYGKKRWSIPIIGYVFSTLGAEVPSIGNLVQGVCFIKGSSVRVLFDFRATHSLVSHACMDKLGLPMRELEVE